jgi:SAM-dependent methyltransferase
VKAAGEYRDWAGIDFRPTISDHLPRVVTEHLPAGSRALDIGCNKGGVPLFLARHGLNVLGIDINAAAIGDAKLSANDAGLSDLVEFRAVDILNEQVVGPFDVVLLTRVLTCFPFVTDWISVLQRANALVGQRGYLYIHDFLLSPEGYGARYAAGAAMGWRSGNFAVNDAAGVLSFIAHHHSEEEVDSITAPWQQVHFNVHESLSLNGNNCRMFEFLGRRPM